MLRQAALLRHRLVATSLARDGTRYDSSRFQGGLHRHGASHRTSGRRADGHRVFDAQTVDSMGKNRTTQTAGGHHRLSEAEIDRLLAHQTPSSPAPAQSRGDKPTGFIVALSGRNQLRGFVEEVRFDGLLGQVRLRIGDQRLTAVITTDALSVLKLRRGDSALAIVKSTGVMIAREADPIEAPAKRRRRK